MALKGAFVWFPGVLHASLRTPKGIENASDTASRGLLHLHNFKPQVIQAVTKNSTGMFRYAALSLNKVNSEPLIVFVLGAHGPQHTKPPPALGECFHIVLELPVST